MSNNQTYSNNLTYDKSNSGHKDKIYRKFQPFGPRKIRKIPSKRKVWWQVLGKRIAPNHNNPLLHNIRGTMRITWENCWKTTRSGNISRNRRKIYLFLPMWMSNFMTSIWVKSQPQDSSSRLQNFIPLQKSRISEERALDTWKVIQVGFHFSLKAATDWTRFRTHQQKRVSSPLQLST